MMPGLKGLISNNKIHSTTNQNYPDGTLKLIVMSAKHDCKCKGNQQGRWTFMPLVMAL